MTIGDTGASSAMVRWTWQSAPIEIEVDEAGAGPTVLLLPALSSISSRREMRPLSVRLAGAYRTIVPDWPGFGSRPRPQVDWTPAAYRSFLAFLLREVASDPLAVVAAGHAATYVLAQAVEHPDWIKRLVMVAPTWRGPLPTVAGGKRPLFDRIRRWGDVPVLGQALYRLNVNGPMLRMMTTGHVYSDRAWLAGERLSDKLAVTQAPGARFASIRFVTGHLDPLSSHGEWIGLFERVTCPVLVIYGAETPPRSRAEMEAVPTQPNVRTVRLDRGKLSVHEEFPDAVATEIKPFLAATTRDGER
jgi:pimeloyl-ACP methyl ester carboxylesterase